MYGHVKSIDLHYRLISVCTLLVLPFTATNTFTTHSADSLHQLGLAPAAATGTTPHARICPSSVGQCVSAGDTITRHAASACRVSTRASVDCWAQ